ncbi:hypothetical protein B0T26DRAFT_290506 [Lasiosphaeria miniovina]|uniref:Uncharacterized protein n=1 Tax=Lasiosphaeria miniovina TaxID=1954250 RepID=A0AA40DVK5_9PEZI|nr:uncharacterized protein B0T26DRAFT_290506 [Lasiosphaeria miniovina]KAK0717230.1 hypothetical protein B0T26DRAFT_290506 [Lasiosphaeria miniovina]
MAPRSGLIRSGASDGSEWCGGPWRDRPRRIQLRRNPLELISVGRRGKAITPFPSPLSTTHYRPDQTSSPCVSCCCPHTPLPSMGIWSPWPWDGYLCEPASQPALPRTGPPPAYLPARFAGLPSSDIPNSARETPPT